MSKKLLVFLFALALNSLIGQNQDMWAVDFESSANFSNAELISSGSHTIAELIISEYQIQQDKDFVISPNPAQSRLNIRLPHKNENLKLEVFDVLGKLIYKREITQLESSVDVSNWKSGVYLVRISNNEWSQTKRFIKN